MAVRDTADHTWLSCSMPATTTDTNITGKNSLQYGNGPPHMGATWWVAAFTGRGKVLVTRSGNTSVADCPASRTSQIGPAQLRALRVFTASWSG